MWRIVMICVGLMGLLSGTEIVMLAGTRQPYRDPFTPYEAIMPGQPAEALQQYPCNLYRDETSTAHCTFALQEGPFDFVQVVYDHTITWIGFTVHPGNLYLGDLIQCWGKFSSIELDNPKFRTPYADVFWGQQKNATIFADRHGTHLSFLLPIHSVSIAGEYQKCRSSQ